MKNLFLILLFISSVFFMTATQAEPTESILTKKLLDKKKATANPLSLMLYNPTYVMPFYYTASPYRQIYQNNTPDNQAIMNNELKGQLSFLIPVIPVVFNNPNMSFNIAYTQLNYWQVYANSQYFRETDYEPEIFLENYFHQNWLFRAGASHQSNGRGGTLERSWNRAFATVQYSGNRWLISLKTWVPIFKAQSLELHNPDIAHYLGYENILFAHKIMKATFSIQFQNIESGLTRGFIQTDLSYPISKHMAFYVQYFNGYGQSLIEYNHRTQAIGAGIAFNNWII